MSDFTNPFLDKLELDAREHDSERFDFIHRYENSNTSGLTRYIPPERIPEGKVIGWITEYINGVLDRDNMRKMLKRGWVPCPATMFPEYISIPMPEDRAYHSYDYEYIRDNGGILCMMDTRLYNILQNEYDEDIRKNINIEQRLHGHSHDLFGAPTFVKNNYLMRMVNGVKVEESGVEHTRGNLSHFGF